MNKVSKAVLCKMYLDDCMPMHVIAKELGVSIGTVYNYCHKYGIQTRDKKKHIHVLWQKALKGSPYKNIER